MMRLDPILPLSVTQITSDQVEESHIQVVNEIDLRLFVNGEHWITFMCTPLHQIELALGFLYNEYIIHSIDQVADYRLCEAGDSVDVWLNFSPPKPKSWKRTSGCSNGRTALELPLSSALPISCFLEIQDVYRMSSLLYDAQNFYKESGGIHISALSDGTTILCSTEDIGRHNTLDKLSGMKLLHPDELSTKIVLTSGRVSSEMMQKSIRMESQIVISRTAPSAFAVELAEQFGVTLIGYAKRNRFIIYSHPERIIT